ncbi:MAG TPA: aminotransferase class V-fold PLP-dependent enzyme [Chloroflexi bacterium]|nr:aminotransferase class V-fold PLP-dependent enzyme [Chloroflexota bacterium]
MPAQSSQVPSSWNLETIRQQIVGLTSQVPLLNGQLHPYISLDNAASTPALQPVQRRVNEFLAWYSSVHRGTGFKSQLSTWAYEQARHIVLQFVGADPQHDTVIFGKNTTESLNQLAHRFRARDERVLTSVMEHHSNLLPWRADGDELLDYVAVTPDGRLDEEDLVRKLEQYNGHVKLVAVSGASNVTGYVPPIQRLAEIAHRFGALILVDGAQLAAHRPISMGAPGDPERIDFLALSAHKMYAPFGSGALIGARDFFAQGEPKMVGGGTIDIVTLERTVWTAPPERDEAGSPNVVGAVALAVAAATLQEIGWSFIVDHEQTLTTYALRRLHQVPGLHLLGGGDPERVADRLGVISFVLENTPHALVAAILAYEHGIGVRHGCFCAHPYMLRLLNVPPEEIARYQAGIERGDRSHIPGAVRASLGIYNTAAEVDILVEALTRIARGEYAGEYELDPITGDYTPLGYTVRFEEHFSFQ